MPSGALMHVSQFAGLIQLRESAAALNKKYFPSFIHHNAGARQPRSGQGRWIHPAGTPAQQIRAGKFHGPYPNHLPAD